MDKANIKKAFSISSVAGNVDGQPLPLGQHELLAREGATSNAPLVESNIVGACDKQRTLLLNKAFRSFYLYYLQWLVAIAHDRFIV